MSRWASHKNILEKTEGDKHETLPMLATQDTMTICYFSRRCYIPQLVLVITDAVCLNTKGQSAGRIKRRHCVLPTGHVFISLY